MPGSRKRLGYWLSQKKCRKLSFSEIEGAFRDRNIEPVKIDLDKPLDLQGPFDGVLHKLTDYIAKAELGDEEAGKLLHSFESYVQENPEMVVMDSIGCLRTLINRYKTYQTINDCQLLSEDSSVFIPPFVVLETSDYDKNLELLRLSKVKFPAVCKPVVAHGSSSAHQMTLIFNEVGLKEVTCPCVVQTFVNHNAVLYKLFALGENYTTVLRPSIKNFHNCEGMSPIHFDGDEVSKSNSTSRLAVLMDSDSNGHLQEPPCPNLLSAIVKAINQCMGLGLFGADVIVEADTGRLAIVDVNAFPGYEGVKDFPGLLADFVKEKLDKFEGRSVSGAENGISNDDGSENRTTTSERLINKTSKA